MYKYIGIILLVICLVLTIVGIMGLERVASYASIPSNTFHFGGPSWSTCRACERYSFILIVSIVNLICGIVLATLGIVMIKKRSSANVTNEIAEIKSEIRNLRANTGSTATLTQCQRCDKNFDISHKYCPACSFEQDATIDTLD